MATHRSYNDRISEWRGNVSAKTPLTFDNLPIETRDLLMNAIWDYFFEEQAENDAGETLKMGLINYGADILGACMAKVLCDRLVGDVEEAAKDPKFKYLEDLVTATADAAATTAPSSTANFAQPAPAIAPFPAFAAPQAPAFAAPPAAHPAQPAPAIAPFPAFATSQALAFPAANSAPPAPPALLFGAPPTASSAGPSNAPAQNTTPVKELAFFTTYKAATASPAASPGLATPSPAPRASPAALELFGSAARNTRSRKRHHED